MVYLGPVHRARMPVDRVMGLAVGLVALRAQRREAACMPLRRVTAMVASRAEYPAVAAASMPAQQAMGMACLAVRATVLPTCRVLVRAVLWAQVRMPRVQAAEPWANPVACPAAGPAQYRAPARAVSMP